MFLNTTIGLLGLWPPQVNEISNSAQWIYTIKKLTISRNYGNKIP